MTRASFFILMLAACNTITGKTNPPVISPSGKTVCDRFNLPPGYHRVSADPDTFAAWLRNIPLKPDGAMVHYYDGGLKPNNGVYAAVLDIKPGNKDLMQCADAVMKLRAEYLYATRQFSKISFTFTNGFRADYTMWREGYGIAVRGNKADWTINSRNSRSYESFQQYLDVVFSYCGTLSLSRELRHVPYADMQPGDVLIKGGTPGHAEIVLDMAADSAGHKIYLLAQGYMPAQEIQVLLNPTNAQLSPWYELIPGVSRIITPEYDFTTDQLMRFR